MARKRICDSMAVAACLFSSYTAAQDEAETCYGPGSVVGAVVGTLIVTLGLFSVGFFLYKMYWKNRKGKHLILMTDAENPNDQYAFDNPCFREATPIKHNIHDEKHSSKLEKNKWLNWSPLHTFGKDQKNEKITSMDDSYVNDSRLKVVTLKGHDFTGLGFNICGNMRDGIFVKDVLHRGPAFESGCINSGDRIDSVCISFRNMVFEDALTILSYASPYDVQVQVENDSYSRPSTLIRSKRESNAVSSAERILHPKYNRSQSISHLNEIGKTNNKKMGHQIGFMQEKNRINQSLNKSQECQGTPNDYPTIKVSATQHNPKKETQKLEKHAAPKISPSANKKEKDSAADPQNKLQKFGIKVLPISMNPKMGVQSVTGAKKPKDGSMSPSTVENEINSLKEKPEKPEKPEKFTKPSNRNASPTGELSGVDEADNNKENVKGMLTKGLLNLKEKINQNTLGKKKSKDESDSNEETSGKAADENKVSEQTTDGDCPVPKLRSSVTCGVKVLEKNQQNHQQGNNLIPEEVSRAGDVARSNRKSITDPSALSNRKSITSLSLETNEEEKKLENGSDSENSEKETDESKKRKKSKGKAPAPPALDGRTSTSPKHPAPSPKELNEIKKESELVKDEKMSIFEPNQETKTIPLKDEVESRSPLPSYDSDSDVELRAPDAKTMPKNTKIELNATQVTIHQNPSGDNNDDDIEPSRKAASLGDLSKLDSEQPLSIVLERAVSLDLTEGTTQSGKKRKAPLPPSEEFPAVFDDLSYKKEPRLENSLGLNTFQRRLKKSSDFGTLEDALYDGPKSLEIEVNKHSPMLNLAETHNYNIQEFSSWLAECRRPKSASEEIREPEPTKKITSTSLVNINSFEKQNENTEKPQYEYQGNNVSFSVNGQNFPEFEQKEKGGVEAQNVNLPGVNSRTVVVISQPNSLEPAVMETYTKDEEKESPEADVSVETATNESSIEENSTPPKLPTSPVPVVSTGNIVPSTMSSPLSSSLTYITEIKVSTTEQNDSLPSDSMTFSESTLEIEPTEVVPTTHRTESVREKIEKFDIKPSYTAKGYISPRSKSAEEAEERKENHSSYDSSKIPIRAMKSETGQKVLATIQSLAAKDTSPTKSPENEYAKRVASLFNNQTNMRNQNDVENEVNRPNISGLYFKPTPPKPSKDYSPTRKVPPVVPPRKMETSLSSKSTVTVELPGRTNDQQERNIVTFSSFIPNNNKSDEPGTPSRISFGEINGGHDNIIPVKTSATKIIFESKDNKNDY